MEIDKQLAKDLSPRQEDFVEVENHCCLCGTELEFEHVHDIETQTLKEKGHCPCCKIQLKEKEFCIH